MSRRRKPQGRIGRWFERVALGAVMGAVAFVAERRLLKVIRGRNRDSGEPRRSPNAAELSLPAQEVDDQTTGQ